MFAENRPGIGSFKSSIISTPCLRGFVLGMGLNHRQAAKFSPFPAEIAAYATESLLKNDATITFFDTGPGSHHKLTIVSAVYGFSFCADVIKGWDSSRA